MTVSQDGWLSDIFGYPVYKVVLGDGHRDALCESLRSKSSEPALLFARVSTERVDQVGTLSDLGFRVVDVNLTFERPTFLESSIEAGMAVEVSEAEPRDHDDALRIAATCFRYSRFHLDPAVSSEIADEIKRSWVSSYLQGLRGEALWIARIDGRPVGFVAMLAQEAGGGRSMVIDLLGVDRDYQGKGVGTALVSRVINNYRATCDRIVVGTQAANIPSMRLYERCGFRVASTTYMLHRHNEGETR